MGILQIMIIFFSGILLGGLVTNLLSKYSDKLQRKKLIDNINSQFKQILKSVSRGEAKFKNRVNNTVFISSKLKEHGEVDIIYMMDNKDIAIFKDNKCIYTSESVNSEVVKDITVTIDNRYQNQINDVVDILGFKFYREEFEKSFKGEIKSLDMTKLDLSDIDKIKKENDSKFTINDVLDKISRSGMDSLTFEERIFLDEYSKNNE